MNLRNSEEILKSAYQHFFKSEAFVPDLLSGSGNELLAGRRKSVLDYIVYVAIEKLRKIEENRREVSLRF